MTADAIVKAEKQIADIHARVVKQMSDDLQAWLDARS